MAATKLLVDGGDPSETVLVKKLLGFVDGQTTNPTLIAHNPEIAALVASGKTLTRIEEAAEYKKIVQSIAPLIGDAGISIEVFSDLTTTAETMYSQAQEMNQWSEKAVIKFPCTKEGLTAGARASHAGMRVNFTLCFTQAQAAAVYAATVGAVASVYVSPFIGRLDDIGQNGIDLISNIHRMFKSSDHHVQVLSASVRSVDHILAAIHVGTDLITAPAHLYEAWHAQGLLMPDQNFNYSPKTKEGIALAPIQYIEMSLDKSVAEYNIVHPLTTSGIEKFVADYNATLNH